MKQEYSIETPNLIKQFISFGIHHGELPESLISHKADLMTILKSYHVNIFNVKSLHFTAV